MIYLNFHFMANILFNYLSGPREIAENGYRRLLGVLEEYPHIRSHLYPSSRTGIVLKERFPGVFQAIRRAVSGGRMRIEFNGYEHAAFNCLSPDSTIRQIQKGLKVDAELWGNEPHGYWPSDCRWDPYVGYLFRDTSIRWVYLFWDAIKTSNPGGKFYPDWRDFDPYRPINIKCPMGARIGSLIDTECNYDLFRPERSETFFEKLQHLHTTREEDAVVCIGLDFETLPVLEVKEVAPDAERLVRDFLDRLTGLEYIRHVFTEEVLDRMPPVQEVFVRQAFWAHFGGASPDGVQKILSLCDTAERDLLMCENLLPLLPDSAEAEGLSQAVEEAWDHLLVGENSEVRFTDVRSDLGASTFYPNESLVLETYDHAVRAYETARDLKHRLFKIYHNRKTS